MSAKPNPVVPFDFNGQMVRLIERDGEPWFVASDVAKVLGYRDAPTMTRMLDDDEKALHVMRPVGPATHQVCSSPPPATQNLGVEQAREVQIISESGTFHAILKSKKPEAKKFRRWVTSELLPSIRRDGFYSITPAPKSTVAQIEHSERTSRRRELPGLLEKLKTEDHPEVRRILFHMVVRGCESEGIDPPAFDAIAPPVKPRPMIAEQFFEALAELREKGVVIDWHRDPALLAVPVREAEAAFRQHGIRASRGAPLYAALRAHEAFDMTGPVNCHDDRSRHCWVFVRAKLPVDLPYPEKPSSN